METLQKIETQVCIVGGGPGGVTTSAYLDQNNIKHVLLEAEKFPRNKPCADTISIHVLNEIKRIYPSAHQQLKKEINLHIIKGLNVYSPNNKQLNYEYPNMEYYHGEPSSYTIRRDKLDHILLEACKELKNSTVLEEHKAISIDYSDNGVTLLTKDKIIEAKMVIVASGCNTSLASRYNLNKKDDDHFAMGLRGYFENVKMSDEAFSELYLNLETFLGGFYISALGNNKFNVNMVMKKGSVMFQKLKFREHFFNHINAHPILKEKFKDAKLVGALEGHGLMLGTINRELSKDNMLFVGDSAGLIDVVTANGIPQAMKSAKIAAQKTVEAINSNNFKHSFLKNYDKEVYKALKKSLRSGRIFNIFYRTESSYKIALKITDLLFKYKLVDKFLKIGVYGISFKKRTVKK